MFWGFGKRPYFFLICFSEPFPEQAHISLAHFIKISDKTVFFNFIFLLFQFCHDCPRADFQATSVACQAAFLISCLPWSNLSYPVFAWSSTADLAAPYSVISKWSYSARLKQFRGVHPDGDQRIMFLPSGHSIYCKDYPLPKQQLLSLLQNCRLHLCTCCHVYVSF